MRSAAKLEFLKSVGMDDYPPADFYPKDVIPFGDETFKEALFGPRRFSAIHALYLEWLAERVAPKS